jgi:hypothetical protein
MKKIENKILTKLNDKIFDDVNVDYRVGVFDEAEMFAGLKPH